MRVMRPRPSRGIQGVIEAPPEGGCLPCRSGPRGGNGDDEPSIPAAGLYQYEQGGDARAFIQQGTDAGVASRNAKAHLVPGAADPG